MVHQIAYYLNIAALSLGIGSYVSLWVYCSRVNKALKETRELLKSMKSM